MTAQAARDLFLTLLSELGLHKHKFSLHHRRDVPVRHLHLVCWCKYKNEGLPHRCAVVSPPGTGPAHSVGLPKSRLEVSRLVQAVSQTWLWSSLSTVSPQNSSSIHPAQLGQSFVNAAAMPIFSNCSFSIVSHAYRESDLVPIEAEGYRDQKALYRFFWSHICVWLKMKSCSYSGGNGKVSPAAKPAWKQEQINNSDLSGHKAQKTCKE